MKTELLAAIAVGVLATQPAVAQGTGDVPPAPQNQNQHGQTQQDQASQQQLQQQDRQFAQEAAAGNQAELELAKMAEGKADSDPVKEYAGTLVEDHTKAGEELKRIAEEQGLTLDPEVPPEAQQAKEKLSGQSGEAFDRSFVEQMITDHDKTIQLYEEQAAKGQNEALKQFATSTLDTLRMHLDQARQLERELGEQATAGAVDQQPNTQPQNPLTEMTASDLVGMKVVNKEGEEVGEIEDIVIAKKDQVVQAVVSVGGFLGIGEKDIAVSFDELQPGREQTILLSGASADELKARPEYDEASGDYERYPPEKTPAGKAL
jgi:putative membrane protein